MVDSEVPRILGATWGDPASRRTYSGVPWHLFREIERRNQLAERVDARFARPTDVLHGAIDWRRSVAARRPQRRALWRYMPETIERLSTRFQARQRELTGHDVVVQFGVAGVPSRDTPLVAHVEISIETALSSDLFASTYRLDGASEHSTARAIEGERMFLAACSVVWTNSQWTAAGLVRQGVRRKPDSDLSSWMRSLRPWSGRAGLVATSNPVRRKRVGEQGWRVTARRVPTASRAIAGRTPHGHRVHAEY